MKRVLANTTDITSNVIECNEEEGDNKTEEDATKDDGDENVDVSALLVIDLSFHDLF